VERGPEKVAVEQDKALGKKIEDRAETEATTQRQQNQIVWFGKLEPLISLEQVQKEKLKSTVPRTEPLPRLCPPRVTSSQRRRIQRMST
jgi:hypothetical protein